MYHDPNAQQPPYGQPPYTSPYEQQYSQPPPVTPPPYMPDPYQVPPVYPPPMYMPPPQPQPPRSNKTLWIVLSIVGGVLLLLIGLCSVTFYYAGRSLNTFSTQVQATATAIQQTTVADEPSPQQQAQNYYLAISAQDYSGAYNYFSSSATQGDGSTLTQTTFTQQAQARDISDGNVTDYTATADPNDATKVTVQVTRAGVNGTPNTYTVHLTFMQGDFQWEISSFDTI